MAKKTKRKTTDAAARSGRRALVDGERTVIRSIRMPISLSNTLNELAENQVSQVVRGMLGDLVAMKSREREAIIARYTKDYAAAGADL